MNHTEIRVKNLPHCLLWPRHNPRKNANSHLFILLRKESKDFTSLLYCSISLLQGRNWRQNLEGIWNGFCEIVWISRLMFGHMYLQSASVECYQCNVKNQRCMLEKRAPQANFLTIWWFCVRFWSKFCMNDIDFSWHNCHMILEFHRIGQEKGCRWTSTGGTPEILGGTPENSRSQFQPWLRSSEVKCSWLPQQPFFWHVVQLRSPLWGICWTFEIPVRQSLRSKNLCKSKPTRCNLWLTEFLWEVPAQRRTANFCEWTKYLIF